MSFCVNEDWFVLFLTTIHGYYDHCFPNDRWVAVVGACANWFYGRPMIERYTWDIEDLPLFVLSFRYLRFLYMSLWFHHWSSAAKSVKKIIYGCPTNKLRKIELTNRIPWLHDKTIIIYFYNMLRTCVYRWSCYTCRTGRRTVLLKHHLLGTMRQ